MRSLTPGLRAPPVDVFGPKLRPHIRCRSAPALVSEFARDPDARGMNVGALCRKMIFPITYFHAM